MATRYYGTQTDEELAHEQERRSRPWTVDDYENVREKATAVARSFSMVPLPGVTRATVDGALAWDLLGALDRAVRD